MQELLKPTRFRIAAVAGLATIFLITLAYIAVGRGGPDIERMEELPHSEVPGAVLLWLENDREAEGYSAFWSQGTVFLAARMGERPTAGYHIHLGEAELEGNQVVVKVQTVVPSPWAIVAQVITYPSTVVGLESDTMPEQALFVTPSRSVLAKVPVINLDEEN